MEVSINRLLKGIIMRRPLSPVLVLIFLLVLSGGCRMEKAHLIVTIDWYKYDSSTGVINVDIRVRNDGEKDIAYFEIYYRVTYSSSAHDDCAHGSNLKVGQSRTHSVITNIRKGERVTNVSVTDVEWKVY